MDKTLLNRRWVHSQEEDTPGVTVYRPDGFAFPPARGRSSIELRADGVLGDQKPGPDDRPVAGEGTWSLEGDDQLKLNWQAPAGRPTSLKIKELSADKLVVGD